MNEIRKGQTLKKCRVLLAEMFEGAGALTSKLDARLLIQHACSIDHAEFIKTPLRQLDEAEAQLLRMSAVRRIEGEPVARIISASEFWSLPFILSKQTLVPRPDTETVVEQALTYIGSRKSDPLQILDLGVGSGCVLLSLLSELPNAKGYGVDASIDALLTAKQNAFALSLEERAGFIASDWLGAVNGRFDIIVSNPPYIETNSIKSLMPEVSKFDPLLALDGGLDGLDAYRLIFEQSTNLLASQGFMVLEFGEGQGLRIKNIFERSPLRSELSFKGYGVDLAGLQRTMTLQAH